MRDKSHDAQIERWAQFVKKNPRKVWKAEQMKLIDSQVIMANRFYKRLEKMPGGKEKIRKLRSLA